MKGQKTGGRVAGTPNKITSELRKMLKAAIAGELERLSESLADLPAKERLDILVKLMPYAMPRIDSIDGSYDSAIGSWDE
jgi:hypothetical protein